jgi:hypothetical protein
VSALFRFVIAAALLMLSASSCKSGACATGSVSCPCNADKTCGAGLVCSASNVCEQGTVVGLQVSDSSARGCEVLLADAPGTTVTGATFQSSVIGKAVVESPRSAISFVSSTNAAISSGAVSLVLSGPASGVSITRFSCVDVNGQRLPNAGVSLQ